MGMDNEFGYLVKRDTGRGVAMLTAGAVMVLLKWVLPPVAPVAVAAYGGYQIYNRQYLEGAIAIGLAVVLWLVRGLVGGLLWVVGAGLVGLGLFFLIRSLRGSS
ncbi:MAG: hypothetical protein V3T00_02835 [bacterium]